MSDNLKQSVQYLKSVGPKRAESFGKIGINTIRDLLFYFPTRYLDRSTILTVLRANQLTVNGYEGDVTIIGKVEDTELIRRRNKIFKVTLKDSTGYFDCVWFQGIKYFENRFNPGEYYAISSKPVITKYGHIQFVHPDFDRIDSEESEDFLNTGKIIPFYRLPKELRQSNIGDLGIRRIIHNASEKFADELSETLPANLIDQHNLLNISNAIKEIHSPGSHQNLNTAKRRFKFEELFYLECMVALRKQRIKVHVKGLSFKVHAEPIKKFLDSLPFELTESQLSVLSEIRKDMESDQPMNRMLQGDVGSGKTIVALIACLIAVSNGYQASIMAPTEILANQHFLNIKNLLKNSDVKVSLVLGGQKRSEKQKILSDIKNNDADIIIGTHALFEDEVEFKKLGLVIIDEQHRFGVAQRARLMDKGHRPDVLVMTATPIPRTLSMTVYGDLDISVIDKMPLNRKVIKTHLTSDRKLPDVYQFVIDKHREGYQSYIVFPLVEESEKLELKAAEDYYTKLKSTYFKDLRVGLLHGRMKWQDKEKTMLQFAQKEFDILISTTVIEVGIDVPDANIIVINDAFRFGLSQLHQLRGRVGRSEKQAYCILVTKDEFIGKSQKFDFNFEYMSKAEIERNKSKIRLSAMVKYPSGFDLSEIDLKLRGPGDIFGTKQSGLPDLKFADIVEDSSILIEAKKSAFEIIENDERLDQPENRIIKQVLLENYSANLKYSTIG